MNIFARIKSVCTFRDGLSFLIKVSVNVIMYILVSSAALYNVNPSNVILVHDDLDRPVGKYSLKHGGSAG